MSRMAPGSFNRGLAAFTVIYLATFVAALLNYLGSRDSEAAWLFLVVFAIGIPLFATIVVRAANHFFPRTPEQREAMRGPLWKRIGLHLTWPIAGYTLFRIATAPSSDTAMSALIVGAGIAVVAIPAAMLIAWLAETAIAQFRSARAASVPEPSDPERSA